MRWTIGLLACAAACSSSRTPEGDAGGGSDAAGLDARLPDASGPDARIPDAETRDGGCEPFCEMTCAEAEARDSHVGCSFLAADLDNAALGAGRNAAAQQFAVIVANPQTVPVRVWVEVDDAPAGSPASVSTIQEMMVPPQSEGVFRLPQREVDGSSPGATNDGTHSALTSNAFRVRAEAPVAAYQLNPLEDVGVFSNDASLLLPEAALGTRHTVATWPQTLVDPTDPAGNLRAFLTIVGTAEDTEVTVELGSEVVRVVGVDGGAALDPGTSHTFVLGDMDVLNLETDGMGADFTGTRVDADAPVAVFVGSEASSVPAEACCGDHLEVQLLSDDRLGRRYVVARTASRTAALRASLPPEEIDRVIDLPPRDHVRIVATSDGTTVQTTLPAPRNVQTLDRGELLDLAADVDFLVEADQPVAVLRLLLSQDIVVPDFELPGGDPSMWLAPAIAQHRRHHIFATPDTYLFDFVQIVAPAGANVTLDGDPITGCETAAVSGFGLEMSIYRCQVSFPEATFPDFMPVYVDGEQNDGLHIVEADAPVAVVAHGFDTFVSYAYAAGYDPRPIP